MELKMDYYVSLVMMIFCFSCFNSGCKVEENPKLENREPKKDNKTNKKNPMKHEREDSESETESAVNVVESKNDLSDMKSTVEIIFKKFDEDEDGFLSKTVLAEFLKASESFDSKKESENHTWEKISDKDWMILKEKLAWCKQDPGEKLEYCDKMFKKWEILTNDKTKKKIDVLQWCKDNPEVKPDYCAKILKK